MSAKGEVRMGWRVVIGVRRCAARLCSKDGNTLELKLGHAVATKATGVFHKQPSPLAEGDVEEGGIRVEENEERRLDDQRPLEAIERAVILPHGKPVC